MSYRMPILTESFLLTFQLSWTNPPIWKLCVLTRFGTSYWPHVPGPPLPTRKLAMGSPPPEYGCCDVPVKSK